MQYNINIQQFIRKLFIYLNLLTLAKKNQVNSSDILAKKQSKSSLIIILMKKLTDLSQWKRLPEAPLQKKQRGNHNILNFRRCNSNSESSQKNQKKYNIFKYFPQLHTQESLIEMFRNYYFMDSKKKRKSNIFCEGKHKKQSYQGEKNEHGAKQGYGIHWFASGDCYIGEFNNNLPNGTGTYFFHHGGRYCGEFLNSLKHGKGQYYSDIGLYEGQFKDGKKDGKGEYLYNNRSSYKGYWKEDQFHGQGVLQIHGSHTFIGNLELGQRHGSGKIVFQNNTIFEGFFTKNDIQRGVIIFTNGSMYSGEWKEFVKSGKGNLNFSNGDKYIGDFLEDTFNGFGQYHYNNGDCYRGYFKNGVPHSKGIYTYKNGTSFKGIWLEGQRTQDGIWQGLENYNSRQDQLVDSMFNTNNPLQFTNRDYQLHLDYNNDDKDNNGNNNKDDKLQQDLVYPIYIQDQTIQEEWSFGKKLKIRNFLSIKIIKILLHIMKSRFLGNKTLFDNIIYDQIQVYFINKMLDQSCILKYRIKTLYQLFNQEDKDSKGYLTKQQFTSLLQILEEDTQVEIKSMYILEDLLIILSDRQQYGYPSCYVHQFLHLLENYRKNYELKKMYEEAEAIQIRKSNLERNQYQRRLKLLKQSEIQRLRSFNLAINDQLKQFEAEWEQHMDQFQKKSKDIIQTAKIKQIDLLRRREKSLRSKSESRNIKASKQLIVLETKQKDLVKVRDYKKAIIVRDYLQSLKAKTGIQEHISKQLQMCRKLGFLKKDQDRLIQSLHEKIQLQRSVQKCKKQEIQQSIALKVRSLAKDFIRKMQEQQKQLVSCLNQQFKSVSSNINKKSDPRIRSIRKSKLFV